jgi:outer membrane murein-binding lipoprotein Lpp
MALPLLIGAAVLGTVVMGGVAIWQTHEQSVQNEKVLQAQKDMQHEQLEAMKPYMEQQAKTQQENEAYLKQIMGNYAQYQKNADDFMKRMQSSGGDVSSFINQAGGAGQFGNQPSYPMNYPAAPTWPALPTGPITPTGT